MQYQGPWLNTEEVTLKTGLLPSEILYQIDIGMIAPVVLVDHSPFLVVSYTPDGRMIGHGHFRYSGPLIVPQSVVQRLVVRSQTFVNRKPVRLLQPHHVFAYSMEYPFQTSLPSVLLSAWEPMPPSTIQASRETYTLMPLPTEYPDYEAAEFGLVDCAMPAYDEEVYLSEYAAQFLLPSATTESVYGPNAHHILRRKNLLFPKMAVDQLLSLKDASVSMSLNRPFPTRIRQHVLHPVIWSLLEAHPNARSGFLWNTLRQDIQAQTRQYDRDQLIVQMDANELLWSGPKGDTKTFKKSSFKTLISRFRQQLSNAQDER